jgi:hypothetical protein
MGIMLERAYEFALQVWPEWPHVGDPMHLAFITPTRVGDLDRHWYEITVHQNGRLVATVARGVQRPIRGVVCTQWDGRLDGGGAAPPGRYLVKVARARSTFVLQRTVFILG